MTTTSKCLSVLAPIIAAMVACSAGDEGSGGGGEGGDATEQGGASGMGAGEGGMGGGLDATGGMATAPDGSGGASASGGAGGGLGGNADGGAPGNGGAPATGGTPSAAPLFTANFENGIAGQAPPSPFTATAGKVTIDGAKGFKSGKSIKVVSSSGEAWASLSVTKILPAPRKVSYTRFMIWMNNLPGNNATSTGHWDIVSHFGLFKGDGYNINGFLSFGGFGTSNFKLHNFGDDTGGKGRQDCSKSSVFTLPLQQWACVEMKVDADEVLNYGVSIDGKAIQNFSFLFDSAASNCVPEWNIAQGTWYVPEINTTKFGFNHVHAQATPVTLWIDDIVISGKPIGCPAP